MRFRELQGAIEELAVNTLAPTERERILARLEPLAAYLGAPGDWGYDTRLGAIAYILKCLERQLKLERDEATEERA